MGRGKALMLQEPDAKRITSLQHRIGAKSKVDVVRQALSLLERRLARADRDRRWARAVGLAATESRRVNAEIQSGSLLHNDG
jgi:Arc/MetJ-type ribon-helix-helix transcriptional regulator